MENIIFIKIEIITLFLSFLYILYYILVKLYNVYFKVKKAIKPEKIENKKSALNKLNLNFENIETKKNIKYKKLSNNEKEKINDIIKKVKFNTTKWQFDLAKNLIIEWLSIDEYNRDLKLELAHIYEKEKKYLNTEYICKDLLNIIKFDFEVMKLLWYVLALQNKMKESLEIYEKIHKKKMANDEIINILAELTFSIEDYEKALKYSNLYILSKPRDVDKLFIKAESLEKLDKNIDAYDAYKRILQIQPYNTKALDKIKLLESENI